MEGSQVFPFMNHQPPRTKTWLCSPALREGRNLLSPLLEQCWWKRGCSFTFLPGHRLYFPLMNQCQVRSHATGARVVYWAGALSLEEAAWQHALPSPGTAPGSVLCRDGSSPPWAARACGGMPGCPAVCTPPAPCMQLARLLSLAQRYPCC